MDIDDGPSLDIELSNDEDVFVPAVRTLDFRTNKLHGLKAGAFVSKELRRSETASILYESLRKPKELSHLENREEDIDGIVSCKYRPLSRTFIVARDLRSHRGLR